MDPIEENYKEETLNFINSHKTLSHNQIKENSAEAPPINNKEKPLSNHTSHKLTDIQKDKPSIKSKENQQNQSLKKLIEVKEKRKAYLQEYKSREDVKERRGLYMRKYRRLAKEKIIEQNKTYYHRIAKNNHDKLKKKKEQNKAYYHNIAKNNPEVVERNREKARLHYYKKIS